MKKSIKVILIIVIVIVGIVLVDTLQAIILANSPFISWKDNLKDNDSWVDRGLLIDIYYCTKEKDIVTVSWKFKTSKFDCPIDNVNLDYNESYDRIVMIDGDLYYDTGMESIIEARCGVMDGKITSNVNLNQIPNVNNQANFDGNYGYQYVDDNTIDLYIDNKWITFKKRKY